MKIFLAKSFLKCTDCEYNYNKIISIYEKAEKENCDLLIFPEMSITSFPIYDELLDINFLKNTENYIEKIVDFTKGKKTKILLGCPYYIPEYISNEIIKKSQLFNSVVLINDGYIDGISSKTTILKQNLFNEYKYFDKEIVLKNIKYEDNNFDVLISDDIMENKNIFFIKDRDADFVVCLDCEIKKNIETKKQQLLKIAKWTNKNVIYLNTLSFDNKNNNSFLGESFIINNLGEIVYENQSINEDLIEFKTRIIDGKLVFENTKKNQDEKHFLDIIAENYSNEEIIYEIKNQEKLPISKNIKFITFNKKYENNNIEFIDFKKYFKNIDLDNNIKKIIINDLYKKIKLTFF